MEYRRREAHSSSSYDKGIEEKMLHIVVCMKIVIDPEMPFSEFRVDRQNKRPVPPSGVPPLFSPFDENALELALKIKDGRECKITVLSAGKALPKAVLQKALAAGADEAVAVEDGQFDHLDCYAVARVLVAAIKKLGPWDLIFTGRQEADWDAGVVWAGIAEMLDLPCVTLARSIEVRERTIVVERCASDSIEVVESPMPAVVAFSSEAGELRGITLPSLIKAKKREITRWSASDVAFLAQEFMQLKDLFIPEVQIVDTYLVPGESPTEKGKNLAERFRDSNILVRRV
jgi:electron transfer flavoprotein beta subunit